MAWASSYISKLNNGETIQFRPRGNSMVGRIDSGQLVTVEPISDTGTLKVNDIVLCSVHGNQFLHIIKAIRNGQYQIGNNRGGINGWTKTVYGRVISVI